MDAREVKADLTGDGQLEPAGREYDFSKPVFHCQSCDSLRTRLEATDKQSADLAEIVARQDREIQRLSALVRRSEQAISLSLIQEMDRLRGRVAELEVWTDKGIRQKNEEVKP